MGSEVSRAYMSVEYRNWISELKNRYRATQIKAAVSVNSALLEYYWNLGKDISERYSSVAAYGTGFFDRLSVDLKLAMPDADGHSPRNLRYCQCFYELYAGCEILQQLVAKLMRVPWGHHVVIIDKCKGDSAKAIFYIQRTLENGWSRDSLLNWISTDLCEREGQAQTNFAETLPSPESDLAKQLTKDPCFIGNIDGYGKMVGEIYCVRIYNRALDERELQSNHAIDKRRFQ